MGDKLRVVGAIWKPKPGGKSLGSGSVTINGLRQRFVILHNKSRKEGSKQPEYICMSSEEPEVVQERHEPRATESEQPRQPVGSAGIDDDIPF